MSHLKSIDGDKILKAALKQFLDEPNEVYYDVESTIPFSFPSMNVDHIVRSPYVSYTRGSAYADENSDFTSCCVFDKTDLFKESLSSKTTEVSDLDFLDSETAKQQIFRDQASREMEFTIQPNDRNIAGCSLWTPCTRKRTSQIQLRSDFSNLRQKQCVSISEYIGANSEPIHSLSDDSINVPFLDLMTSTPKHLTSVLKTETDVFPDFSELSIEKKQNLAGNKVLSPKCLFSLTPQKNEICTGNFRFYIPNTAYKNINRLKDEERSKQNEFKRELFHSFNEEKTIVKSTSADSPFTKMGDKTLKTSCNSNNEDISELWTIQPQEVILDSRNRNRVLLINNSELSLKFKTKFDIKIMNVSPQFGTVLPMSQMGLRILISQGAKKLSEIEDDIKLIIGKTEKIIHVKIINKQVSRAPKQRSFIVF